MLARLQLAGDERVIDFGCGTGRDTLRLLARVPRGRVIAVDGSAQMLAALSERLGSNSNRVEIVQADLNDELPLRAPADAIFSVATLHWLPDHASVFTHMAAVLRPGGQLAAECGGIGNIATVNAAINGALGEDAPTDVWNFARPDETRDRLIYAGFTDIDVALVPDLVAFDDDRTLERFLATVVLSAHVQEMNAESRTAFVQSVAARMPRKEIDYIRLTIKARKASGSSDANDHGL
jgi:trans-aconitate 2-methyltransferase